MTRLKQRDLILKQRELQTVGSNLQKTISKCPPDTLGHWNARELTWHQNRPKTQNTSPNFGYMVQKCWTKV